jgi:hypothetical protein
LLSTKYKGSHEKLDYICNCGRRAKISWTNFQQGIRCKKCAVEKLKTPYEVVKQEFENAGCKLLSTKYKNNYSKLEYVCKCGRQTKICLDNFKQGQRCNSCGNEERSKVNKKHYVEGKCVPWNKNLTKETDERVKKSGVISGAALKKLYAKGILNRSGSRNPNYKGGPKLRIAKQYAKRKSFGFIPLNDYFEGSEGHHIDKEHVIYTEKELHRSVRHKQSNPESMDRINTKVYCWLLGMNVN